MRLSGKANVLDGRKLLSTSEEPKSDQCALRTQRIPRKEIGWKSK